MRKNIDMLLIVSLMIVSAFSNCNHQNNMQKCNHDRFINYYTVEEFDSDTLIINCEYIFFADVGYDSVIITDNFSLFEIYKSQYIDKFSDFKFFMCSLYDNEFVLKKEDIDIEKVNKVIFKKDKSIIDSLRNEKMDDIKDHYFTCDDFFRTDIEIDQNKKYNILYFFFKNEYYITHSDYDGSYLIIRLDSISTIITPSAGCSGKVRQEASSRTSTTGRSSNACTVSTFTITGHAITMRLWANG